MILENNKHNSQGSLLVWISEP